MIHAEIARMIAHETVDKDDIAYQLDYISGKVKKAARRGSYSISLDFKARANGPVTEALRKTVIETLVKEYGFTVERRATGHGFENVIAW